MKQIQNERKPVMRFCKGGTIHFSKRSERRFFFWATLFMLLLGILEKLGVFQ